MNYLDQADIVAIGAAVLDRPLEVRDWGLVASALARPATTVFGDDAYATVFDKAAALLLSLVTNHPFVDGNKRMGLAGAVAFLLKNGLELELEEDQAYDFVLSVADGTRREVDDVAAILEGWARPLAH
ncbi:MAG: type II toxin-antitoxin system death-on-curing family toxin [Mycobacteriales bacterium]